MWGHNRRDGCDPHALPKASSRLVPCSGQEPREGGKGACEHLRPSPCGDLTADTEGSLEGPLLQAASQPSTLRESRAQNTCQCNRHPPPRNAVEGTPPSKTKE